MTTEKEIDIGNDVWGHVYEIKLSKQLKSEFEIIEILDEFCSNKDLNEQSHNWNKINFDDTKRLLRNCLTFDIAYSSCRISNEETVEKNYINLISRLNINAIEFCYSNCFGTPWGQNENGYSWNDLTEQTFDIGVVMIDSKKILFAYFMSED